MACPDPNLIAELAAGVLAEPERAQAEAHLVTCEACRAAATELRRAAAPETALAPGAAVGRYLVVQQVGAGAMGAVYAAYDPELDRKVALKLLHRVDGQERLVAEGRAMARLAHPNVVQVLDLGATADDRVFVAMEFVEGITLRRWLAVEPRSWREVAAVLIEAGRGLAAAHAVGLLHRDFKPENLLIGRDGRTRVGDFGLSRASTGVAPPGADPARTLELVGTPAYMAPEQFRCQPATARSDQFSFCVVLWEALYGRRPFDEGAGTVEALAEAVLHRRLREPPSARRVPAALRRILLVGLAADPAARFPSMEALLSRLERATRKRRRAGVAAVAAAAALALLGGGAAFLRSSSSSRVCRGAGGGLAGAWSPARRAAIAEAFRGSGVAYAPSTWARVEPVLDAWASAFSTMGRQACEATEVARTQPREVLLLRNQCLDERQAEFASLIEVLERPTPGVIERAPQAAAALRPVADCADVKRLVGPLPPPASVAAEAEALRRRLAAVRARIEAGAAATARDDLTAVAERARAIGDHPLAAEALTLRARQEYLDGAIEPGLATAQAAVTEADLGRDDRTRALALIRQIPLAAEAGGLERARRVAESAHAVLTRAGGDDELAAQYEAALGTVEHNDGSPAAARDHFARAIALSERRFGADAPQAARFHGQLGTALMIVGDYDAAEAELSRALAIIEKTSGRDHPAWAVEEASQATLALVRGDEARAIALATDARARLERVHGTHHPSLIDALDVLNTALGGVGRLREALAVAQRMYEIGEREGADSPDACLGLLTLGGTNSRARRFDEAERALDRVVALIGPRGGVEQPDVRKAKARLAVVYLARHDTAKARAACEAAARGLPATDEWGWMDAEHCFARVDEAEGAWQRALERLRRQVAADEKRHVSDAPWGVGADLVSIGRLRLRLGHADEAAVPLERALAGEPTPRLGVVDSMVEARLRLAQALARRDRARSARLVREALDLAATQEFPDPALVTELTAFAR